MHKFCGNHRTYIYSNLYLDTQEPMNYEYDKIIISTSWVEKLPKKPPKTKILPILAASGNAVPKSVLNAFTGAIAVSHITEQNQLFHREN